MTKDPTVPEAGFLAVGGSAEGVHLLFFWGGGCLEVVFLDGRRSEGRPFFPGLKKGRCAFGTHQVGRRKNRGMQSLQYFYCFCSFIFPVSTCNSLIHATILVSFVDCPSSLDQKRLSFWSVWTSYLPRPPPQRTVTGRMPINHRKVFF